MYSSKYFLLSLALSPLAQAIWPIPVEYTKGNTSLFISPQVNIAYSTSGNSTLQTRSLNYDSSNPKVSTIIKKAIRRARKTLFEQSFVPWKFHPRNADFEPSSSSSGTISQIVLQQLKEDPANILNPDEGSTDESYTLQLTSTGQVTITANTSIGISHGLTSFVQLFFKHSEDDSVYTPYAPVTINDYPVFKHRGFNLDVARSYYPVDDIKRTIDALAFNKFNKMHLHITDGQSWPLEVPALPELSAKGAYNKALVYTSEDLDDIQSYGAFQGIDVYLEIDMPGHTSSVAYSHPELVAAFNKQPNWSDYAAEPPSGTLQLNNPDVPPFITQLLDDVLDRVSKHNTYFHSGGDEVKANAYSLDPTINSADPNVIQPYLQKFIDHAHQIIRSKGMQPIVWEEMLLQWNLTLPSDVVIQAWQSDEATAQIVQAGHRVLAGNYNYWYLDCGIGQWVDSVTPGPPGTLYLDYCSPRKNWRVVYSYDPRQGIPKDLHHLVIGGEVHIWSEQIDPVSLDRQAWPRAAAAAEVLWSGASDPQTGQPRDQPGAALRLSDMRERLVAKGVMSEPVHMPFCTMEEGQCLI